MNEQYHQFNEMLMQKLNPTPELSFENQDSVSVFSDIAENMGQGNLLVQVTLAKAAIPIEGAKVTVTDSSGNVVARAITDQSGRTEQIPLPAPSAEYSQNPGGTVRPYSIYNIQVAYPGYYVEDAVNVPIFDKVNSIQPIPLEPLPDGTDPEEKIIVNEAQTPNL
ncbi:hypothetical protein [Ructibacterium gallinarum]|uniref:Carboxypeptidase regulatory-like domain-containing protein n=1 Tax=Ructibacterium gallinarum TaxID=2779355 RepID=A0A9D5RBK6_9FIRM|nr:hypothetical protein [Ructibacterium gallinarum]MBE5040123.1 hypothetical protein [Ructibacterium gallinarum]